MGTGIGWCRKDIAVRLVLQGNGMKTVRDVEGFTLMELMVVCILMGMLLSFAMPTLKNTFVSSEIATAVRKVGGFVADTRQLAVREHKPYTLSFDLDNQQYWYELDGSINPFNVDPASLTRLPEDISFLELKTYRDGVKTSGVVSLWVSEKGYMDQTVVRLANESGEEFYLLFLPFSSAFQIIDGYEDVE